MKKFFYSLSVFLFLAGPALANGHHFCDRVCVLYQKAHLRKLHPTKSPLVCVNFTLPPDSPAVGAKVVLRASRDNNVAIKDSKVVMSREGQFCYPRARWLRAGGEPDKVFLCSVHSVTLWNEQIPAILSGRGNKSSAYACLRGVAGCGGVDNVSLPSDVLDN